MDKRSRVPKEFYKLFSSKYIEEYQLALIALYEESSQSYSLLGLTEEECQEIIRERLEAHLEKTHLEEAPPEEAEEEDGPMTRQNLPLAMLRRLEGWGWLRRDYDETLNRYVVSFPDYSQMFVEVFRNLFAESDHMERGSILTIYSHLFTYYSDSEKNNDLLKSALRASKALQQMLSDMQEGIRGYFEELSEQKTFIGVQQVLVNEINNSDSEKYAILTTTDSFYRYKEEIKGLLDKIFAAAEREKQSLVERAALQAGADGLQQNRKELQICGEAMDILFQINREFDGIERRYSQLIDQKRIFAKRAAARIRYILAEGDAGEDRTKAFIRFLDRSSKKEELLEDLARGFGLTARFSAVKEKSFAKPRSMAKREFLPQAVDWPEGMPEDFGDFVVKPLYTHAQLSEFKRKNIKDGAFVVTERSRQDAFETENVRS